MSTAVAEVNRTEPAVIPMSRQEARSHVSKIQNHITDARILIEELYNRQGWKALGYSSWRECVTNEFRQGQAYMYRLLRAAQIERNLSPIGEIGAIPESQLRPLTQLPPEEQKDAWLEAQKRAADAEQPVTAATVQAVVQERIQKTVQQLLPVGSIFLTSYNTEPNIVVGHTPVEDGVTVRVHPFWMRKEGRNTKLKTAGFVNYCRVQKDTQVFSGCDELFPISAKDAEWLYAEARKSGHYYGPDLTAAFNQLVVRLGRPEWARKLEPVEAPKSKKAKPTEPPLTSTLPAVKCFHCKEPVGSDAVTVGNHAFHPDCKDVHYAERGQGIAPSQPGQRPPQEIVIQPEPVKVQEADDLGPPREEDDILIPQQRLEEFVTEMFFEFSEAIKVDDDGSFGERFLPLYENLPPIPYWAKVIRKMAVRILELEANVSIPSQSVSIPSQSDLTCPLCHAPDFGKCACDADAVNALLKGEALPNPFLTRDGYITGGADERLQLIKKFDLPQLRAALQVPNLQKTVRDAAERRIARLERAEG